MAEGGGGGEAWEGRKAWRSGGMREGSVLKLRVAPERRRAAASNGRWERDFFLARGGVSTCHLTVGAGGHRTGVVT